MVLWSMFQQVMSLVCALEAPIGPLALGGRDCSVHSQQATEYQRARRKSPYEQAYGKQATVEYLRVYGCMAEIPVPPKEQAPEPCLGPTTSPPQVSPVARTVHRSIVQAPAEAHPVPSTHSLQVEREYSIPWDELKRFERLAQPEQVLRGFFKHHKFGHVATSQAHSQISCGPTRSHINTRQTPRTAPRSFRRRRRRGNGKFVESYIFFYAGCPIKFWYPRPVELSAAIVIWPIRRPRF
ncbi:hypothetical protein H106_05154 [Trichophyton rubrum CBS 735.88]|nr:hypothetical protein H106_05154 [Trichophyton rubrum CBS 735.88]